MNGPRAQHFDTRRAFTLIELLLVLALMSVFTAMVLAQLQPTTPENLHAAAEIITADLAYVRSLAVANDSRYRIEFDGALDQYALEHTGARDTLDVLPRFAASPAGPSTRRVQRLTDLPLSGFDVEVEGIESGNSLTPSGALEFDPLGEIVSAQPFTVWLACGRSADRRYLPVRVAAATGLADIGELQATPP